jgi:hypothetical protein
MLQGSGLWWWEDFAAAPASRRKVITGFVIVLGFLLSVFLIGGLSHSKIGLVDENDLPQYVGTDGHIAFSKIPRLLLEKTEVGEFGKSQRFRPVYYLTRLTETALWGLEGGYWYSWRVVMFGTVIAAMLWLYTQCTGLFLGAALTAYTLSFAMWVDIWTRSTGPSEQYAALGSAICAVGAWQFVKRWRAGESLDGSCLAMAVGAIIAMGSKENMLLLELPLLAMLAAGLWHRRIGLLSAAALIVAIVFGVWVASSIAVYFLGARVEDIYGNSVHSSLLGAAWMRRVYAGGLATVMVLGAISLVVRKIGDKEKLERYRSLVPRYVISVSAIVGVFVFNFLFYTGMIPTGARYDFPAVLALPALLILLLEGIGEIAGLFGFGLVVKKAAGLVLAIALVAYVVSAPWELQAAVKANVARNTAFEAGLSEAQRITAAHPQWPIFIKSFNFLDYEVIQALGYFFVARSINNPRYLVYVANRYGEPRNAFQAGLDQALQAESSNGMLNRGYLPLVEATSTSGGDCFVVILRKPEQCALDQASGKNPIAGENCARIPPSVYWDNDGIHFDPPR